MSQADEAVRLLEEAGEHDSDGRETEAAPLYEQALALGLPDDLRSQATIQYASTLRNLGRAEEAVALLRAAPEDPSTGAARQAFLALALHSAGHHDAALRTALEALVPTLPRYQRSLTAYAEDLTEGEAAAP